MRDDHWNLWQLWASNARMGAELAKASQSVIDQRSKMLRDSAANPFAADYAEMWLMGAEKVVAFTAAGAAAMADWPKLQQGLIQNSGLPVDLATNAARSWSRALKPIHAAATANERRLRKKRKR